ncbi:MAG: mannose-1-phosphate guanyltransferase [Opitutales bacterium]|nr:mannose-1-phosphate guanyltransferase [Opitutales bacterium]
MSEPYVVIMAGGRGERFWPQSRLSCPKHLLPIVGESPMLAQTVARLEGLVPPENVFVVTNREQREATLEACPDLLPEQVVGEPMGRDTAAAVGLAALLVKRASEDAVFAMLPADHVIDRATGFREVLRTAFAAAAQDDIFVTIGVRPTEPATGYGYVQRGDFRGEVEGRSIYEVKRFVEKPDLDTASGYLESGDYFWNAGMFVWRPEVILNALAVHAPELREGLLDLENRWNSGENLDVCMEGIYPELPRISIDYAVMEKADNVVVVESDFDWDDVGEWPAVGRHFPTDEAGNVSKGEVVVLDSSDNLVISPRGRLTALLGVEDLIVVETDKATLVCHRSKAQEVKQLVQEISRREDGESWT